MIPDTKGLIDIPIFFIVGRGRSGSTLLRTLLNAHPEIIVPYESRFVQFLYYKYNYIKNWTPKLALDAITSLNNSFEPPSLDHHKVFQLIKQCEDNLSFSAVCKIIYLSIKTENEKVKIKCIGDKNPRYTFFIPQLIKIFPNAKFIHLVRDYRANTHTVVRASENIGESKSIVIALARWKYYHSVIEKNKKRFLGHFYTIRYEDLIAQPEKTLTDLCNFTGVKYNNKMLDYSKNLDLSQQNEKFRSLHKSLNKPLDSSKISEWQDKLNKKNIKICEILSGKFGEKYNYFRIYKINPFHNFLVQLIYGPLFFVGKLRFIMKRYLYHYPILMSIAYFIIRRKK